MKNTYWIIGVVGPAERRNSKRLKTNHYDAPHANTAAIPPAGEQWCEPTRASGGRRLARVALVIWRVKTTSRRRSDCRKQKPWREVLLLWVAKCDSLIGNLAKEPTVCVPLGDICITEHVRDLIGLPRTPYWITHNKLGFCNSLAWSFYVFRGTATIVRRNFFLAIVIYDNFTTIWDL